MNGTVEILGTLSSVVVAVSLTQKNIQWLRILNFIGAAGFGVYGYFIWSIPVLGLNTFIAVIDLFYYVQLMRKTQYFDHVHISSVSEFPYVTMFLEFYKQDIHKYHSGFDSDSARDCSGVFILRDMRPVSLILYRDRDEKELEMVLDYAIPEYQDFKNGQYFFKEAFLLPHNQGKDSIRSKSYCKEHDRYLKKLGFTSLTAAGDERSDYREFRLMIQDRGV